MGYCESCDDLRTNAPNVIENGIGTIECNSLKQDTGLNPSLTVLRNNCQDLSALLDCLIGGHMEQIRAYNDCEWKRYIKDLLNNLLIFQNAMVCNECGQWEWIWELLRRIKEIEDIIFRDGYINVTQIYHYTVPQNKFIRTTNATNLIYWSGSPDTGESYIDIPITEMDIVDTVIAQPKVVGGAVHAVTVAIQSAIQVGNMYQVNFDTYEIIGNDGNYPFAVPIDFVVHGRKKVR